MNGNKRSQMKNKRIIFEVTHPKHFHQFKNIASELVKDNEILFLARDKDVVIELLEYSPFSYEKFRFFGKNIFSKVLIIPKILNKYRDVFKRFKPDYVLSRSSPYSTLISRTMRFKSVIFPDSEIVGLTKRFVAPLAHLIIVPKTFELVYNKRQYNLAGFFEESYLSPISFKPDESVLTKLGMKSNEKFFILRFVAWNANHDVGQFGFKKEEKQLLIKSLKEYGKVLISSERKIEKEFEQYRFHLPANEMHSALHFASLYAGDSQSMATESALLGTPSLRYNSFVGENDMSNFRVLENDHKLLINLSSSEELIKNATRLAKMNTKDEWLDKRDQFFKNRKDLNEETIQLLNKYLN